MQVLTNFVNTSFCFFEYCRYGFSGVDGIDCIFPLLYYMLLVCSSFRPSPSILYKILIVATEFEKSP